MACHRLDLSPADKVATLAALEVSRDACVDVSIATPIRGDAYRAALDVIAAIDRFAEVLTGDRQHFWLPLARTPVLCARCAGTGWLCEAHPYTPHPHDGCTGTGLPCPVCNAGDPPRPPKDFISLERT